MADLLQFVCENSDQSQISAVLKRFVRKRNSTVDINFLESLKLVLLTLEKSQNLSEDLATEVVKDICWPILLESSLAKDAIEVSGNNRKRLHLCYDIATFCFSIFPAALLMLFGDKSLQIFKNYLGEKSSTEENARDVSVALDLIGNLVKSDALNFSGDGNLMIGEVGDQLFQQMLNLLPHATDMLCAKVTCLVLPRFLEFKSVERCQVSKINFICIAVLFRALLPGTMHG